MRPTATNPRRRLCSRTWLPAPLGGLAVRSWRHARLGRPAMASDSTLARSGRQGPPLPDTDLAQAAGSNFLSNIALEPGSTSHVESLVKLQAEAAGDDFFLDLGAAAEDGLDAAEPPELTIEVGSSGPVFLPVKAGLHWVSASRGVRPVRSRRHHPPWDRLAAGNSPVSGVAPTRRRGPRGPQQRLPRMHLPRRLPHQRRDWRHPQDPPGRGSCMFIQPASARAPSSPPPNTGPVQRRVMMRRSECAY